MASDEDKCCGFTFFSILSIVVIILVRYLCQTPEKCDNDWIPLKMTDLKLTLHQNLYGQHLVIGPVVSHLRGHFEGPRNKALVLSFHGTTGTGKNFVSKFVTNAMYERGVDSKFVHFISATRDFPHQSKINEYKDILKHKIQSTVKECPKSLFVIDETDKMLPGLIDIIKPYLDYYDHINGIDYRKTTFIYLSNTGGAKIAEAVIEMYEHGIEREKITFKEMEDIIRTTVLKEGNGLWHSSLVKNNLITAFIPFLPLERKHVKQCIVAALFKKEYFKAEHQIDHGAVDQIANELMYFPNSTNLFFTTGCKRVFEKIDLVMQLESMYFWSNVYTSSAERRETLRLS